MHGIALDLEAQLLAELAANPPLVGQEPAEGETPSDTGTVAD